MTEEWGATPAPGELYALLRTCDDLDSEGWEVVAFATKADLVELGYDAADLAALDRGLSVPEIQDYPSCGFPDDWVRWDLWIISRRQQTSSLPHPPRVGEVWE